MEKVFGKARRIIKREHDCIITIIIFIIEGRILYG